MCAQILTALKRDEEQIERTIAELDICIGVIGADVNRVANPLRKYLRATLAEFYQQRANVIDRLFQLRTAANEVRRVAAENNDPVSDNLLPAPSATPEVCP